MVSTNSCVMGLSVTTAATIPRNWSFCLMGSAITMTTAFPLEPNTVMGLLRYSCPCWAAVKAAARDLPRKGSPAALKFGAPTPRA